MLNEIGILLFVLVTSLGGLWSNNLTLSGAIAAFVVGISIAVGFGWQGLLLLGVFFVSSSFWSKFRRQEKLVMDEILEKGEVRDWVQVAANGGFAAIYSILYWSTNDVFFQMAFILAIASANADTWASEIGSLSHKQPISLKSFKKVEKGTSGAISMLGTISSFIAALLIAGVATIVFQLPFYNIVFIGVFGLFGSVIDTLLGAFIQVKYQCEICMRKVEKNFHCGNPTKLIKGVSVINNDIVNALSLFISSIFGALVYPFIN